MITSIREWLNFTKLNESTETSFNVKEFVRCLHNYYNNYKLQLELKYPGNPDIIGAPDHEFNMRFGGYNKNSHNVNGTGEILGFIVDNVNNGHVIKNNFGTLEKDRSKYMRGCYYNALSYILKYRDKYPTLELAYGFMIPQSTIDNIEKASRYVPEEYHRQNIEITKHAFLVLDGKILDPTLGDDDADNEYYIYEVCPESVYTKFTHKENDENFNGRKFKNYIDSKIAEHSYPFEKLMKYPVINL